MKPVAGGRQVTRATERELEVLDRILACEGALMPSSSFVSAVMDRVCEESAAPPPLGFPWRRVWAPGALVAGLLGWSLIELLRSLPAAADSLARHAGSSATLAQAQASIASVALALAAPLLAWLVARRFADGPGLF